MDKVGISQVAVTEIEIHERTDFPVVGNKFLLHSVKMDQLAKVHS